MSSGRLLASSYLSVVKFVSRNDLIELHAASRQTSPTCPLCAIPSLRVQSRYTRTLADLPWHGVSVRILLLVRRMFCDSPDCPRKIFAERLPGVAAPYARRTKRLAEAIELIGFLLGGEAGARTAAKLGIRTSPDTLIRAIRTTPLPKVSTPRVLGIDDWSMRRGHKYGTILVDLERHRRIDVLPDRKAETLAEWLKQHPGVEVISRDRADVYSEGVRLGAPKAIQVLDRWHLLKNLGDALERFLTTRHETLVAVGRELTEEARREAAAKADTNVSPHKSLDPVSDSDRGLSPIALRRREQRLARYERTVELFESGWTKQAVARELNIDLKTVRKYVTTGSFPERAQRRSKAYSLQLYQTYLEERWAEGCRNATEMWREIRERGYKGSAVSVRRLIRTWRDGDGRKHCKREVASGSKPAMRVKAPSPRRARWLLVRDVKDLDAEDQKMREKLLALCPEAAQASSLACEFQEIVRQRKVEELAGWLRSAKAGGIAALASFAAGLESERQYVEAALELEWSNGQVEGQVNWIKTIKRQMFGRASFDLLRRRILWAG